MARTAASLAREALEQLGIRYTFGIPGVHNTELYDEFGASESITPVLVAHEGGGAFMADAVSRTGAGVGALLIVPAAGVTHAASGIGEAFLDGIPMVVIAGGIRRDLGRAYQLHDMDQHALLAPITKARWRIERHADVIPVIHEAYRVATSGEPGPVFVEIPVNLQLMPGDPGDRLEFTAAPAAGHSAAPADIARAAELLRGAKHPGIFCGWGAVDATAELIAIAELIGAPVATTLQGLSSFPGNHRLHAGFALGTGRSSSGRKCICALRLPARRRHALRGDSNRELRLRAAREPHPRGHQPARLRRELPARGRARGGCPRRTCRAARCAWHDARVRARGRSRGSHI